MKIKLLVICVMFCSFYSCIDTKRSDLEKMNLKGKVKSICDVVYDGKFMFGKINNGTKLGITKEFVFNSVGNKIIEKSSVLGTGLFRKDIFNYDSVGNKISMKILNSKGILYSTYTYKNNLSGKEIECNKLDSSGRWVARYIPKYDKDGNLYKYIRYKADGSYVNEYIYKYDSDLNEIEWNCTGEGSWNNNKFIKYTYYNPERIITSLAFVENINFSFMDEPIVIESDSYNYCKAVINSNPDRLAYYFKHGTEYARKYFFKDIEYDEHHNWIRKVVYFENNCIAVINRDIKYY